jgi:hypothetical protein
MEKVVRKGNRLTGYPNVLRRDASKLYVSLSWAMELGGICSCLEGCMGSVLGLGGE